jgi:hypothetical protein
MGDFRIEVNAVGGHGCQREIPDGAIVNGCGRPNCPDCIARRFVRSLKESGADVKSAALTHWPGSPEQVKDDLLSGIRTGSFR